MLEIEKENLFDTFEAVIRSIINEKRLNSKTRKKLFKFEAKLNLGLQVSHNYLYWLNLNAKGALFKLGREKLQKYDFEIIASPDDLLFFCNGQISILQMITQKNKYGQTRLKIKKGTTGRNLIKVIQLSKFLVLD